MRQKNEQFHTQDLEFELMVEDLVVQLIGARGWGRYIPQRPHRMDKDTNEISQPNIVSL